MVRNNMACQGMLHTVVLGECMHEGFGIKVQCITEEAHISQQPWPGVARRTSTTSVLEPSVRRYTS